MATTAAPDKVHLSALPPASGRAGIVGTIRSEYTKLWSVRSTYWTLLVLVLVCIGLCWLISGEIASHFNQIGTPGHPNFDATNVSLEPLSLGMLVIAVLGTLVITTEYSTGMIRTSLTAQPRRGVVYVGKALVFGVIALVIGEVLSFIMFFLGQALLHSTGRSVTLSDSGVTTAVVGGGLFLAVCGLFAFGIGSIIRHTAGAIAATIGLLFVLPIVWNALPQSWQNDGFKFLPSQAGMSIWRTRPQVYYYGRWTEFLIFVGYTAALLIVGYILFKRRDA
jgi:ABC-type transport system involved in multi-copper enzyme maturation permease subunit